MYTCTTCAKTFTRKQGYESHLARKKPCVALTPAVKPVLKWVGGKTQILAEVIAQFPREMVNYREPFLGGGSVLLAILLSQRAGVLTISGTIYASDINANIINLYLNVQSRPEELIAEVAELVREFAECTGTEVNRAATTAEEAKSSPESWYFWVRSQFNAVPAEERASVKASAMMLFLNKTCFRGLYREGPRGFNVPFGNYKNPTVADADHIRLVSELIRGVVFETLPFAAALAPAAAGDFTYLDPPYVPASAESFVTYTAGGFAAADHTALFGLCHDLTARGVKLLMSNSEVHLVTASFPQPTYITKIISCRRAINSKKPDSRVNELLIAN
jgi:DNA adenine methylase